MIPVVVAAAGAIGMALAFPKTDASVLAPVGAAGLFWAWFGLSPKRAFWIGWIAGTIYFALNFSWFGQTAGALIAPFGFLLTLGPALIDGFVGFALAGLFVALLGGGLRKRTRCVRALVPLGGAAAFATLEWVRAEGMGELGVPFGCVGYSQTQSVFSPLGAFVGVYGITLTICLLGAYGAYALRMRAVRGAGVDACVAAGLIVAGCAAAWMFWPARSYLPPTLPVAAVQGDIPQSLKFAPGALATALERYTSLTLLAARRHPALVVWPETVLPTAINEDPALQSRLGALARSIDAELVVGTLIVTPQGAYNVLESFTPSGALESVYRKRQLVPFAEHVPWRGLFSWIPWSAEVSNFIEGDQSGVFSIMPARATAAGTNAPNLASSNIGPHDPARAGTRIAPVICWESAFTKITNEDVRDGATLLLVATDDAWFGETAGPYMNAQIAQMRAIETGRWIVRAASTGISGIIAPDGRYVRSAPLDRTTVVPGAIGEPVSTAYVALGAPLFALLCALAYVGALVAVRSAR